MSEFLNGRVRVIVGDITRERVDAVVNAANKTLLGGGGVDGAIHRAGGLAILEACQELRRTRYPGGLPVGEAVITTAGNLPARHVIHTVGPVFGLHDGREAELLAACYTNSLRLAAEHALASVAFPAISTGAFGYPREDAARVASTAIKNFLDGEGDGERDGRASASRSVRDVRLIFFSESDARVFLENQSFG